MDSNQADVEYAVSDLHKDYRELEKLALTDCESGLIAINVAVFASLTGTMAANEIGLARAYLMAMTHANSGSADNADAEKPFSKHYRLVPNLYDGESSNPVYRVNAEKLREMDPRLQCRAVFGCWTSAARKTVQAVFGTLTPQPLYFYPVQFEGLESDKHTIYTGAVPNQQVFPVMKFFSTKKNCQRYFIVGSDYNYPRAIIAQMIPRLNRHKKDHWHHLIPFIPEGLLAAGKGFFDGCKTTIDDISALITMAKDEARERGRDFGRILKQISRKDIGDVLVDEREEHALFKAYHSRIRSVKRAVKEVVDALSVKPQPQEEVKPQVLFNFVNGDANQYLFQEILRRFNDVRDAGLLATVSFSMTLDDLAGDADGGAPFSEWTGDHYLAASYFPDDDPFSLEFQKRWTTKKPGDASWNAYASVLAFVRAVETFGTHSPKEIKDRLQYYFSDGDHGKRSFRVVAANTVSPAVDVRNVLDLHSTHIDNDDETISVMAARSVHMRKIIHSPGGLTIACEDVANGIPLSSLQNQLGLPNEPAPYPSEKELMDVGLRERVDSLTGDAKSDFEKYECELRNAWRDFSHYLYILGDVVPELEITHHLDRVGQLRELSIENPRIAPDSLASFSWLEAMQSPIYKDAVVNRLNRLTNAIPGEIHDIDTALTCPDRTVIEHAIAKVTSELVTLNVSDADIHATLHGSESTTKFVVCKAKALGRRINRIYLFDLLHYCALVREHPVVLIHNGISTEVKSLSELEPIMRNDLYWDLAHPPLVFSATAWNSTATAGKFTHLVYWDGDGKAANAVKYQAFATAAPHPARFEFRDIVDDNADGLHSFRTLVGAFRRLFGDLFPEGNFSLRADQLIEDRLQALDCKEGKSEMWLHRWPSGSMHKVAIAGCRRWNLNTGSASNTGGVTVMFGSKTANTT